MKTTYRPGEGFPKRLASLLYRLGKRPADVERDTKGVVKADTVSNWLKARHFPEKFGFYHFCRTYRLDNAGVSELLFGRRDQRDEGYLERCIPESRLIAALHENLDRVEQRFDQLPHLEQEVVLVRLQETLSILQHAQPDIA